MRILGLDEAGRGSVLGPLVIGAYCCEEADQPALREAGADDSKALSAKKRVAIRERLMPLGTGEIRRIGAPAIDQGNLNRLEEDAFVWFILHFRPHRVYIDAPVHPRGIPNLVRRMKAECQHLEVMPEFIVEPKADSTYAVVGAASIFAKVDRDASMDILSELHGVPLGSGYPSDPRSRAWIKGFLDADEPLPPCVRSRWGTIDNLRQQSLFGG